MAPDAPAPVYNSNGRPMGDWLLVVRYNSTRDVLSLSWTREKTPWSKQSQGAIAYPPEDLPDLIEGVTTQLNVLGQPRLF